MKVKTYPLNGSPAHYHAIIHTGSGKRQRERVLPSEHADAGKAIDAARHEAGRTGAVAAIECRHPKAVKR